MDINYNLKDKFSSHSRVAINNLYNWSIGYYSDVMKQDIVVPPSAKRFMLINLGDILDQVARNNFAYVGVDGFGSHAALEIIDDDVREFVFNTTGKPKQFTMERVKKMISYNGKDTFEKALNDVIVTHSEAMMMLQIMDDVYNSNEEPAWKTKMLESHCKYIIGMRNQGIELRLD